MASSELFSKALFMVRPTKLIQFTLSNFLYLSVGTPVAVKMLKMDINRIDPVTKQSFEYEVGLMSEIHHPNILMFLGASTTDEGVPCIITEYLERGA